MRKLVIYRQMITTAKALDILKNCINMTMTAAVKERTKQIRDILDHLINNHEHMLLRHIGKTVQIHQEEMEEYKTIREQMLDLFDNTLNNDEINQGARSHLLLVVAEILDYNEQLERLEILLNSAEQYHLKGAKHDLSHHKLKNN